MQRKTFLKLMVHSIGATVSAVLALPIVVTALTPLWTARRTEWQPLGELSAFPLGGVEKASVAVPRDDQSRSLTRKGVYVWRAAEREIIVYSRSCTDLGCPVTWDPGSACFFCPCHGGIFAKSGVPLAGPPNRPLYRFAHRVRGGILEIDLNSLPPMT